MIVNPGRCFLGAALVATALAFVGVLLLPWFLALPLCIGLAVIGPLAELAGERDRRRQRLTPAPERVTTAMVHGRDVDVVRLVGDELPPLPPAIPVEMRDPAFGRRARRLDELAEAAEAARIAVRSPRSTSAQWTRAIKTERMLDERRDQLRAKPLIADRAFTALTHCPLGHVGTHWLGAITTIDDVAYLERTCRFERCAHTWLEKR